MDNSNTCISLIKSKLNRLNNELTLIYTSVTKEIEQENDWIGFLENCLTTVTSTKRVFKKSKEYSIRSRSGSKGSKGDFDTERNQSSISKLGKISSYRTSPNRQYLSQTPLGLAVDQAARDDQVVTKPFSSNSNIVQEIESKLLDRKKSKDLKKAKEKYDRDFNALKEGLEKISSGIGFDSLGPSKSMFLKPPKLPKNAVSEQITKFHSRELSLKSKLPISVAGRADSKKREKGSASKGKANSRMFSNSLRRSSSDLKRHFPSRTNLHSPKAMGQKRNEPRSRTPTPTPPISSNRRGSEDAIPDQPRHTPAGVTRASSKIDPSSRYIPTPNTPPQLPRAESNHTGHTGRTGNVLATTLEGRIEDGIISNTGSEIPHSEVFEITHLHANPHLIAHAHPARMKSKDRAVQKEAAATSSSGTDILKQLSEYKSLRQQQISKLVPSASTATLDHSRNLQSHLNQNALSDIQLALQRRNQLLKTSDTFDSLHPGGMRIENRGNSGSKKIETVTYTTTSIKEMRDSIPINTINNRPT